MLRVWGLAAPGHTGDGSSRSMPLGPRLGSKAGLTAGWAREPSGGVWRLVGAGCPRDWTRPRGLSPGGLAGASSQRDSRVQGASIPESGTERHLYDLAWVRRSDTKPRHPHSSTRVLGKGTQTQHRDGRNVKVMLNQEQERWEIVSQAASGELEPTACQLGSDPPRGQFASPASVSLHLLFLLTRRPVCRPAPAPSTWFTSTHPSGLRGDVLSSQEACSDPPTPPQLSWGPC